LSLRSSTGENAGCRPGRPELTAAGPPELKLRSAEAKRIRKGSVMMSRINPSTIITALKIAEIMH
jgi:hypothetical protein